MLFVFLLPLMLLNKDYHSTTSSINRGLTDWTKISLRGCSAWCDGQATYTRRLHWPVTGLVSGNASCERIRRKDKRAERPQRGSRAVVAVLDVERIIPSLVERYCTVLANSTPARSVQSIGWMTMVDWCGDWCAVIDRQQLKPIPATSLPLHAVA